MSVLLAWGLQQADPAAWPVDGAGVWRSVLAVAVVATLLALFVWLARRGAFGLVAARRKGGTMAVESALPLGERRTLVVVSVEGRRLLLGMTPVHVSLVAELQRAPTSPFAETLEQKSVLHAPESPL